MAFNDWLCSYKKTMQTTSTSISHRHILVQLKIIAKLELIQIHQKESTNKIKSQLCYDGNNPMTY